MLTKNHTPYRDDTVAPTHVRALFLSDTHLGSKGCQADQLLDFLRDYDADTIYLVGDIIDVWLLRATHYWPQEHSDVIQKLLRKARKGARIIYVPGNHDEFVRNYFGSFGNIEVADSVVHVTADGRQFLVIHGDYFDLVVRQARWLAILGGHAYDITVLASRKLNLLRRWLGFPYWSISQWAKDNVKNAMEYIGQFEKALTQEARLSGADGVICGHIHHATINELDGLTYINCGDWVESCTAVIEHEDGRFEIVRWSEVGQLRRPMLSAVVRGGVP
jgi:UDP-2,3-diacylglucosamine pyrophosphatase LpxH